MSTLKSNAIQLGTSATATQNFTLRSNADGTATLARGNVGATSQDILTVDAAGKVVLPAGNEMLGVGQTWTQFTVPAQRAAATNYTNSTGKPIMVTIRAGGASAVADSEILVGGVIAARIYLGTNAQSYSLTTIVPSGAVYRVNIGGAHTMDFWAELR